MNRRPVLPLLVLLCALSACGSAGSSTPATDPAGTCTPSPGGRCAADVPWPGRIQLSADGRRLRGVIDCGGTLHATEAGDTVTLTLHVGAMGPGTMSCVRARVGVRLARPLGSRSLVDGVSGKPIRVVTTPSAG
jgi:hypothetical protein